mgnify:FL=1
MQVIISGIRWNSVGPKEAPRLEDENLFPEPITVEVDAFKAQTVLLPIAEWGLKQVIIMKTGVGLVGDSSFRHYYDGNPGLAVQRQKRESEGLSSIRGSVLKPWVRGNHTIVHALPHVFFDAGKTSMIQIAGNGVELKFNY